MALPAVPEQHAIAAALSDVDSLIGALDELLAKKRAIKHGTMQQLLGKNACRGHKQTKVGMIPVNWEVTTFEEICTKIQDGTHFSPKVRGGE
jgi:type I restriction enzyme S subunit